MEGDPPTAELSVRALRPDAADHVDDAVSRLRTLETAGVIDALEVAVWGRQLPVDGAAAATDAAERVRDTVEEIESWAASAGVAVDSQFEPRVVDREFGGRSYRARRLPTCCLVERVDGEIRAGAPHERNGETWTVADRLAALEARPSIDADPVGSDRTAIAE